MECTPPRTGNKAACGTAPTRAHMHLSRGPPCGVHPRLARAIRPRAAQRPLAHTHTCPGGLLVEYTPASHRQSGRMRHRAHSRTHTLNPGGLLMECTPASHRQSGRVRNHTHSRTHMRLSRESPSGVTPASHRHSGRVRHRAPSHTHEPGNIAAGAQLAPKHSNATYRSRRRAPSWRTLTT